MPSPTAYQGPILDVAALMAYGAAPAPYVQGSLPSFVVLFASTTPYNVVSTDLVIDYLGNFPGGRTVNLPAATGSGRVVRIAGGPLTTSANACTIQPAGADQIGGGLAAVAGAGGTLILQSGDSYVDLQDSTTGKWTILDRSTGNVTAAKTGTAYVISEWEDVIPCDTTAAVTVSLPATPVIGEKHLVVDVTDASMHTLTISRNGNNINGAASNATITTKQGTKTFQWLGGTVGWLETSTVP